jgi:hypothetical protein
MKYLFSIQLEYLNKGLIRGSLCLRVAVVNSYLCFFNEKVQKSQPSDMLSVFSIGFQQYSGLQSTEAAGTSCTADACSIGLCSSLDELITGRYKRIKNRNSQVSLLFLRSIIRPIMKVVQAPPTPLVCHLRRAELG